jgi:energy-coupling factor transport system ATP-binding protein
MGFDEDHVFKVAKRVGVEHLLNRYVHDLSDGEKKLVTIACALIGNDTIALDEPFANLHPDISKMVMKTVLKNAEVIVSDHRLEFYRLFEDRFDFVWIEDGRIFEDFDLDRFDLFDDPGFDFKHDVGEPVLRVEDLTFGYDEILLEDISFEVRRGEICAIVGKNGCGKTTLLKILAGILKPWSGNVWIKGKKALCMSNPNYHLFEETVGDCIQPELVKPFGLEKILDRHPHSLSFGQAKRVAIAKAFRGDLVLLDEPTAGQDLRFKFELLRTAKRLKKTVVMATHDDVWKWCDVVVKI